MFEQIRKLIEEDPENVTILEEVIDVDLQMDYFKKSLEVKKKLNSGRVIMHKDDLFASDISIDEKRMLLSKLASINDVDVFRAIEKYMKDGDKELHDWAILAYQESRMLIQSSLMEKAPIFISTGLGGKKDKLRYCVVLFNKNRKVFSELEQNIIKGEVDYIIGKTNSVCEELKFEGIYCTLMLMIPLKVSVKDCLLDLVKNCNELGGFVDSSFLVTNVKHLSDGEIMEALSNNDSESVNEYDKDDAIGF